MYRRHDREMDDNVKEQSFNLDVVPLIAPVVTETTLGLIGNMHGVKRPKLQKVMVEKPEDGLELKCKARGTPQPQVTWSLNGRPLDITAKNVSRYDRGSSGYLSKH